jgi:ADP-heptose:LPS heptosyltransferase
MRVLVVKLGALGDIFFALPLVRYLRSIDSCVAIDWIVGSSFEDLVLSSGQVRRAIRVDERTLFHGSVPRRISQIANVRLRQEKKYDLILLLHRSLGYLPMLLGKGPIVMPHRSLDKPLMNSVHRVLVPPLSLHESLCIKAVTDAGLRLCGVSPPSSAEWQLPDSYRAASVKGGAVTLGVHIGGGSNSGNDFTLKRWPYFGDFVKRVLDLPDIRIILFGASSEASEAEAIMRCIATKNSSRIESRIGKTALLSLATEMSNCDVFVGVDSGPLHIADALGIPCLGLYGPTSHISWGLLGARSQAFSIGTSCSPCYHDDGKFPVCRHSNRCMRDISPEIVVEKLLEIIRDAYPNGRR